MSGEQQMVAEFHRTFDIAQKPVPTIPDEATRTQVLVTNPETLYDFG